MAEDCRINVDLATWKVAGGKEKVVLAWGDDVVVTKRTASEIEVEAAHWKREPDGSMVPVTAKGTLKRKIGSREVAVPRNDVRVLEVSFADVQQGDGALVRTPSGELLTIDAGGNQLFARFLAGRIRGTSEASPRELAAMIVTHGDADHFAGLTQIHDSETHATAHKRLFVHPQRVYHNGLVKRPKKVPELERLGPTAVKQGKTIVTGLVDSPLDVSAAQMNEDFKHWRKALLAWEQRGPIEYRRLARGVTDAFDFLGADGISVDVLGPLETKVGGKPGLAFLGGPASNALPVHLEFEESSSASASHTINGHSIVLRLQFGNVRILFAGDLNNAAENALVKQHEAGTLDLQAEVLKVPHHGSHEFSTPFLGAVAPVASIVSSGDESTFFEHIHPRATLVSALGRCARDDSGVVFVTELAAFFEMVGNATPNDPEDRKKTPTFFAFKRAAFGLIRVRTDGKRLLVFSDSGERDLKEAYAWEVPSSGTIKPTKLIKG